MDELHDYLSNIRIALQNMNDDENLINLLMVEISGIATNNWMDELSPELSQEQLISASRRVMAKFYNKN